MLKYNENGTLDTNFNNSGFKIENTNSIQEFCESINIQSDGKILVSGEYKNGSTKKLFLMRYIDQNLSVNNFNQSTIKIINPVKENLEFITEKEINKISIFNTLGKLILETNQNNINTSNLSKGIYISVIEFKNDENKYSYKLIKN